MERKMKFQLNQLTSAEQKITHLLNEIAELTSDKTSECEYQLQIEKLREENFVLKDLLVKERRDYKDQIFEVENQNVCEFCEKRFKNVSFLSDHVLRRHEEVYAVWVKKQLGEGEGKEFRANQRQQVGQVVQNCDESMLEIKPAEMPKIPFLNQRNVAESPCHLLRLTANKNTGQSKETSERQESSDIFINSPANIPLYQSHCDQSVIQQQNQGNSPTNPNNSKTNEFLQSQSKIQQPTIINSPNSLFSETGNLKAGNDTSTYQKAMNHITDFNEFLKENEKFMKNNSLTTTLRSETFPSSSYETNSDVALSMAVREFEGE